jgi:hypothetical protein
MKRGPFQTTGLRSPIILADGIGSPATPTGGHPIAVTPRNPHPGQYSQTPATAFFGTGQGVATPGESATKYKLAWTGLEPDAATACNFGELDKSPESSGVESGHSRLGPTFALWDL